MSIVPTTSTRSGSRAQFGAAPARCPAVRSKDGAYTEWRAPLRLTTTPPLARQFTVGGRSSRTFAAMTRRASLATAGAITEVARTAGNSVSCEVLELRRKQPRGACPISEDIGIVPVRACDSVVYNPDLEPNALPTSTGSEQDVSPVGVPSYALCEEVRDHPVGRRRGWCRSQSRRGWDAQGTVRKLTIDEANPARRRTEPRHSDRTNQSADSGRGGCRPAATGCRR